MDYRYSQEPTPLTMLDELRDRIPGLHPFAALALTLEPMLLRGEISSETYLHYAAAMRLAQGKPLFSAN